MAMLLLVVWKRHRGAGKQVRRDGVANVRDDSSVNIVNDNDLYFHS
ncbi:hypothetical protein [Cupriavidus oxalaticus]|nr:hypothetical protein [Cupriavidus oxalaticus]